MVFLNFRYLTINSARKGRYGGHTHTSRFYCITVSYDRVCIYM